MPLTVTGFCRAGRALLIAGALASAGSPPANAQSQKTVSLRSQAGRSAALNVSTLGLVSIASADLRPLWGTGHSLGLGPSLSQSPGAKRVVVSASHNVGLVKTDSGWSVVSLRSPARSSLPSAATAALGHSGQTAILYSADTRTLDVFAGLPESPVRVFSTDLSGLSLPVVAAAVDDEGNTALIATSDGRNGSMYIVRRTSGAAEIAQTGVISAIRFTEGGKSAVATDQLWDSLLLIDVSDTPGVHMLADGAHGVSGPADVSVDTGRQRLFVANSRGRNVAAFSFAGQLLMNVECSFEPSQVSVLPGADLVTISSAQSRSAWLLRPDADDRQPLFIPVVD